LEVEAKAAEAEVEAAEAEVAAFIGRAWRRTEQTALVGGRQTDQNASETGRVVRMSECVASG
jgi:hypothetical protein